VSCNLEEPPWNADSLNQLHRMRRRYSNRPRFVPAVPPPEVGHTEEGVTLRGIVVVLAILIRSAVRLGDRTLSLWFG